MYKLVLLKEQKLRLEFHKKNKISFLNKLKDLQSDCTLKFLILSIVFQKQKLACLFY